MANLIRLLTAILKFAMSRSVTILSFLQVSGAYMRRVVAFVPVAKIPQGVDIPLRKAYPSDVGYDIRSAVDVEIPAHGFLMVPMDMRIEIPEGYYVTVFGRSGLASEGILTHHGLVDTGYRGRLGAILYNFTAKAFSIHKGERIAQIVFHKTVSIRVVEVSDFNTGSDRSENAFGSSHR